MVSPKGTSRCAYRRNRALRALHRDDRDLPNPRGQKSKGRGTKKIAVDCNRPMLG